MKVKHILNSLRPGRHRSYDVNGEDLTFRTQQNVLRGASNEDDDIFTFQTKQNIQADDTEGIANDEDEEDKSATIHHNSQERPQQQRRQDLREQHQQQLLEKTGTKTTEKSFVGRHSEVSKGQMKEFREAFRLFDKDGDGSITKEELGRVMRSLGQFARTEELQQMLQEVDVDGDGNVSFEEFVGIAWSAGAGTDPDHILSREEEEKELRDAFRVFDKHNRGYITASDLRAVLQCLGEDLSEEEIEDMIKEVDVDGDGRIDFYEFVNALGEPGTEDSYDDEDEEIMGY